MHKSFDEVWKDIQIILSNLSSVETLVQRVKNDLISIEKDHVKVMSEKTRRIRKVPRSQFECVWNSIVNDGFYISRTHKPYIHSPNHLCDFLFAGLCGSKAQSAYPLFKVTKNKLWQGNRLLLED